MRHPTKRVSAGAVLFFALLTAALVAGVMVVRARTPDLVLEVTVGPGDLGRLIGKGGRVANAIRTIAKAASTRADRRVLVEFIED